MKLAITGGEFMIRSFSQLAKEYEAAESAVSQAIDNQAGEEETCLSELDGNLRRSYDAMISQDLSSTSERLERIAYLLGVIEQLNESGTMVKEIADTILRDASSLHGLHSTEPVKLAGTANMDRTVRILSMCS